MNHSKEQLIQSAPGAGRQNGHLLSWLWSPAAEGSRSPERGRELGGSLLPLGGWQWGQLCSASTDSGHLPLLPRASLAGCRWSGNQSRRPLKAQDLLGRLLGSCFAAFQAQQLQNSSSPSEVLLLPPGCAQELEPCLQTLGLAGLRGSICSAWLLQTIPEGCGSSGTGIRAPPAAIPGLWDLLVLVSHAPHSSGLGDVACAVSCQKM